MTTTQLKQQLLSAHQRDKKLSLLGFILIIVAIAIVASLVYVYAYDAVASYIQNMLKGITDTANSDETPFYYKLIVPAILVSMLAAPVLKLIALTKRPKLIDELILKIDNGTIASNIDQRTVYKIIIPLLKINIRLAPVEYVTIVLDQDTKYKPYDLPIEPYDIPDLKLILSGVNTEQINKAWDELYSTSENKNEEIEYPLKPKDEFKKFIDTTLFNEINQLEQDRNKDKKKYIKYLIFSVIIVLIFGGGYAYLQLSNTPFKSEYIIYAFFIAFGLSYAYIIALSTSKVKPGTVTVANSSNSFKTKILKPMIDFINPNFHFVLHGHITLPELLETGLLQNKHYIIDGNDQILGAHKGVPFQMSDLDVAYQENFSSEKSGPDQVFYGQAFIAKFNKKFSSELYLVPKKTSKKKVIDSVSETLTLGMAGTRTTDIDMYTSYDFGSKVMLEDPEFSKLFNVYCNDQTEARYILTPALMDKIKSIANRTKGDLFISFKNNRISILNNSGLNNFEPGRFKSLSKNDNELLLEFYSNLHNQLSIIDDLKLNINIWNKNN
ncbi:MULTISPECIES: DUF3137 domain-containing protein [unclassified Cellulophaga]|uniref:DUF3137 domain-containing protein n=1 Tax=unclassified Cellulophaga TaxID=2634405 RepID=UPI0026E37A99|nr:MULTISPECIES: DUF3137 domain-containing protein [unclassified Cellulophaga]MDO6490184.1 DUF3137 domain-containing protein [Cellulophaga sp. 2_MG-2023]MDO6494622.1 DUF3137 domain-containing protein [Cellulophaga sp. 3_MG-2023]